MFKDKFGDTEAHGHSATTMIRTIGLLWLLVHFFVYFSKADVILVRLCNVYALSMVGLVSCFKWRYSAYMPLIISFSVCLSIVIFMLLWIWHACCFLDRSNNWSRNRDRRDGYRETDRGQRDRRSPVRREGSPPQVKRMRRDWGYVTIPKLAL